jgi:HlyD family secretion protein
MRARLKAEQGGALQVTFPKLLLGQQDDARVRDIVATHKSEYATRREKLDSEIAVIERRRNGAAEEIIGLVAQQDAVTAQVGLIARELGATEKLYKEGYTTLTRLLALRRSHAQLKGDLGQVTAQIARAREKVAEHEREIAHLKSKHAEAALEELRQVEADISDLEEQVTAARDVLGRLEVRAPVKGVVVALTQNTSGGVLASGQDIVELLPIDEDLIVEARVQPQDIDSIAVGHTARVRLTALNQRVTPVLDGEVVHLSADVREDKQDGSSYYLARIKLPDEEAARLQTMSPVPGMPVEVFIDTGARTFADYILRPVMDSFTRAFRES